MFFLMAKECLAFSPNEHVSRCSRRQLKVTQSSMRENGTLTCPAVNGEEPLGIAAGDPVGQPVAGPGVRINGIDLDDWHVFGGVLHDRGVVDGLRGLRRVVVDVLHLDEDLDEGGERHHAAVHGVDR